jgi:hypothetical protein
MFDARPVNTHFTEPTLHCARYVGAGAAAPTPVASVKDAQSTKTSITRSGVGALVVTLLDVPLGVVQTYDFWAACPANDKNVRMTPPTAGSYAFTLQVGYHANGVAVDLAATEELCMEVWTSRSQVP